MSDLISKWPKPGVKVYVNKIKERKLLKNKIKASSQVGRRALVERRIRRRTRISDLLICGSLLCAVIIIIIFFFEKRNIRNKKE